MLQPFLVVSVFSWKLNILLPSNALTIFIKMPLQFIMQYVSDFCIKTDNRKFFNKYIVVSHLKCWLFFERQENKDPCHVANEKLWIYYWNWLVSWYILNSAFHSFSPAIQLVNYIKFNRLNEIFYHIQIYVLNAFQKNEETRSEKNSISLRIIDFHNYKNFPI